MADDERQSRVAGRKGAAPSPGADSRRARRAARPSAECVCDFYCFSRWQKLGEKRAPGDSRPAGGGRASGSCGS